MTLARLLAAALVVCSVLAFAQKKSDSLAIPAQAAEASKSAEITSSEPWKLIPNRPADLGSGQNPFDRMRVDQYQFDLSKIYPSTRTFDLKGRSVTVTPSFDGQLDADTTCLKIRSYVVARDSKDSDSTHPVSYSTCQPASRYRLKTTEMRTEPVNR
jgi:hypothetical protein